MDLVFDVPALEAFLANSGEYATAGGLWCCSHEGEALHRHLKKQPKARLAEPSRRDDLL